MSTHLHIVDDPGEAEACDYVICMRLTRPLVLPDNVIDVCCKCGEAIQHRPSAPKKPPKVCMQCIQPQLDAEAKKGELNVVVTKQTANEVATYIAKKDAN